MNDIAALEKRIGFDFKDKDILRSALVHRSYLNEHPDFHLPHNERLEFLGDAVLELIVTEYLYTHYPNPEGELTNWRAALVNAVMLASIAAEVGLEEFLYLSRGESKDAGSKARQFILANAFEAVIGALYIDRGLQPCREYIGARVLAKLPMVFEQRLYQDPKSKFQEAAQERVGLTPTYRVLSESGPDHAKVFVVGIYLGGEQVATGSGSSKQEAQVQAAEKGLQAKNW